MPVETTPLGYKKPDGKEMVRNGDNVIAENAQLSQDLHTLARGRLAVLEAYTGETVYDGGDAGTAPAPAVWEGGGLDLTDPVVAALLVGPSETRDGLDALYRGQDWARVNDYFAADRVPGTTDDLPAFEEAIATGKRCWGEGDFHISQTPDWGDNAFFVGTGEGKTTIKLLNTAPAGATLWGVRKYSGAVQGYFADFTLDGNCYRQGGTLVAAGGSQSSTFTLRNARHFTTVRVTSIDSLQHGFDVTLGQEAYAYVGDGNLAINGRSSDNTFIQCKASNFGDDGFTTHSADYTTFTNCIGFNPRLRGNCNGIEVDGDSRYTTLNDNRTFNCYAGVEVKGHGSESAAQYTAINGHIDTGSVRSYNFRHIGQQSGADPISLTARGITCTNLVSIDANNDAGFQDDATPRAMSISAYQEVTVNGFLVKGRGGYGSGDIAVQVQYRASAQISGLQITGWSGAELDISLTTSGKVSVSGSLRASAANGVYVGSTIAAARLDISATAPAAGAATGLDIYNATNVEVSGASRISGYATNIRADLTDYASVRHFERRAAPTPAGLTSMKALDASKDYYLTTTQFAACTTDRPDGATGGHFVTHSRLNSDATVQTLTKNTTGTPLQYFRVLYWSNQTASAWHAVTAPAVAYSAT